MKRTASMILAAALCAAAGCEQSKQAGETSSTAAPLASGKAVSVCSFASVAQVEAAMGGAVVVGDPEPQTPSGSLLGGCKYTIQGDVTAMVSARPAVEFDGTVAASDGAAEVAGLGERAVNTPNTGVLVKLPGKDYFLAAFVMGLQGIDRAASENLARAVIPGAK